jgi:uncharacterized membrane protein (TIGR01666 family)
MQPKAKEIQYFFYSQAFADGLRTTVSILLPSLILSYFKLLNAGLSISLGALCVSLADAPGPMIHKRNGMLFAAFFVFIITLLTSLASANVYTMGILILFSTLFFSMFNVYGVRASAVGSGAILAMILTMDKIVPKPQILSEGILILLGSIWYFLVSLAFYKIQPYRAGQRILGECIRSIATFLSIKADFYNPKTDLEKDYSKMVAQQVAVNEKQDAVREILFKTRQIVSESTTTGRKLVLTFVETIDLFEDITATYYDYASLRKRYENTGVLEKISWFIKDVAFELDQMGIAIQVNSPYKQRFDFEKQLLQLKEDINETGKEEGASNIVLRKILVNVRRLVQRVLELQEYFEKGAPGKEKTTLDHSHFVTHQSLDPKIFLDNLSLQSSVFKHASRVAIASIFGYIFVNLFAYGHHSYWVLMTIVFMLKPAFSLTKQRNIERIIGTVIGGLLGIAILLFVSNKEVLFAIMVVLMILNYSLVRINYLAMVLCLTPFVLILFSLLGVSVLDVAKERILDTVLGCTIAFSAGYFLFPTWEAEHLEGYLLKMLQANKEYLNKIYEGLYGKQINLLEYKLVRKEVYVSSANVAAAFQRMLSEPKNKQRNSKVMHQFVVLNHILFSNIATVVTSLLNKSPAVHAPILIQSVKRSTVLINQTIDKLGEENLLKNERPVESIPQSMAGLTADDQLIKDQLDFIQRVIIDLDKTTTQLISSENTE